MTQYQNHSPRQTPDANRVDTSSLEQRVKDLGEKAARQAEQIQDLSQQVKRLKNELRTAVNAFNLRSGR